MDDVELAHELHGLGKRLWADAAAESTELTEPEYLALAHLAEHGSATVGEVRERIKVTGPQMSRLIRRLEDRGQIVSRLNQDDKRKINLELTDKGREAHHHFASARIQMLARRLEPLTAKERGALLKMLRKMAGVEPHR